MPPPHAVIVRLAWSVRRNIGINAAVSDCCRGSLTSAGRRPNHRKRYRVVNESMRQPLFSSPTHGLPQPTQYLHRARMFVDATLGMVDYSNSEVNWPKYALLLQAT